MQSGKRGRQVSYRLPFVKNKKVTYMHGNGLDNPERNREVLQVTLWRDY